MKLIVGLGNPDKKYENTRHNAGYLFVDQFACHKNITEAGECLGLKPNEKFGALIAETTKKGEKIVLVKPTTYMNLSGEAVSKILQWYKAGPGNLIIIADDKDLPLGQARVRQSGGSAGQKGLQNIIDILGTEDFTRIRLGIDNRGRDIQINTADYVLSKFSEDEKNILVDIIDATIEAIAPYLGTAEAIPAQTISPKSVGE